MARIEGEIIIGRPVEVVFDFAADQRNEPRYNPRMIRADKVSDGPVGKGTVFRSIAKSMGQVVSPPVLPPNWRISKGRLRSTRCLAGPGCAGRGVYVPRARPSCWGR